MFDVDRLAIDRQTARQISREKEDNIDTCKLPDLQITGPALRPCSQTLLFACCKY